MTDEVFYGEALPKLEAAREQLLEMIRAYPEEKKDGGGIQAIMYCCSRIKSADSMRKKLEFHGLPADCETALDKMYDAVGIRVICSFFDEVYRVAGWLKERPQIQVLQVKDYLAYPKANGYRSYHIILSILEGQGKGIHAEIQLRTMAIDFWASLEHQMKYKHKVRHEALIRDELKRCADEIASVDLSMQTIRDLLAEDFGGETGDKIEK